MIKADTDAPIPSQGSVAPEAGAAAGENNSSAGATHKLAKDAEALCADLERFFRSSFGDMPKSTQIGELRVHQAAIRNLAQEASGSSEADAQQLLTVTTERDKLKDAATRARADFLNYQSRTAKDLERAEEQALRGYIMEMLTVLDSLDLAEKDAASESTSTDRVSQALQMISTSLRQMLTVRGLQRMTVLGSTFDPTVHETVAKRPADLSKGEKPSTVVEELRAGYMWKGLLLRPAQVLITEPEKKANGL